MYQTLAGDGFLTPLRGIRAVVADGGKQLQSYPFIVRQAVDPSATYLVNTMLQEVMRQGTGHSAYEVLPKDYGLVGKTGTTNDSIDAWFCGFQKNVVGISWIGFDQPRSLGDKETGGGAALPIWINYMATALKGVPEAEYPVPENMVALPINNEGLRDESSSRIEYFYQENVPSNAPSPTILEGGTPSGEAPLKEEEKPADIVKDQLL